MMTMMTAEMINNGPQIGDDIKVQSGWSVATSDKVQLIWQQQQHRRRTGTTRVTLAPKHLPASGLPATDAPGRDLANEDK
jgi:hypothetical protein